MSMNRMMDMLVEQYPFHVRELQKKFQEVFQENPQYNGILIHSGKQRYRFLDDTHYPFRVNPHFVYWAPLTQSPHCYLWITPNDRPQLFYFMSDDFWSKPPAAPEGYWTEQFTIHEIRQDVDVQKILGNKLSSALFIGEFPEDVAAWNVKASNDDKVLQRIHYFRTRKTPYEQSCLKMATWRAAKGHKKALELFRAGHSSEFAIHLAYQAATDCTDAASPYDNIVAFNENAAILHYVDYGMHVPHVEHLHSFLLDAGSTYNGRAADITRTYSFHEEGEFADLINAVDKMQLQIIDELRVGQLYTDNHIKCHSKIAQVLLDFGFVKDMTIEAMVEKKVTHRFFPHGLGHFLGIQVHDVGAAKSRPPQDHPYLRLTAEIGEGHIFTIEPGLYFIEPLLKNLKSSPESSHINWNKVDRFMKYGGIRIEDNIICCDEKFVNVTREAF